MTNGWQLDKHVPIALIVTLLLQTGGAVWWGATVSARVDMLEKQQVSQQGYLTAIQESVQLRGERLASLETGQKLILEAIQRIDGKINSLRSN